jgi:hypothetical protein
LKNSGEPVHLSEQFQNGSAVSPNIFRPDSECDRQSLVLLQSQASTNDGVASQVAVAADRVTIIVRIHRHLNPFDGLHTIEFKKFLWQRHQSLCVRATAVPDRHSVNLHLIVPALASALHRGAI